MEQNSNMKNKIKRECLIFSTHTKYEWFSYEKVSEIPTDWLKKHIGNRLKETEKLPVSILDGIDLIGYNYYKVYDCSKGILQYFNNEIGFRYKTGSYMYIRFYYYQDCIEYLKRLLKDYEMEFSINFHKNYYPFSIGDTISPNTLVGFELNEDFYRERFNAPDAHLEYFDKKKAQQDIEEDLRREEGDTALVSGNQGHSWQIQTIIEDDNGVFVIPALIPDVTQFRFVGVPGMPYCSVGPEDMVFTLDKINLIKRFDDNLKEV